MNTIEKHNYDLKSILDVLGDLNQEEKKGVIKLIDLVINNIYNNDINNENIEECKNSVRKITSAYGVMKDKFSIKYRSDGDRYFEHLREVANIILESDNPSVDKVLIALYHDSIEDVGASFEIIKFLSWDPKIAIAVEAMSKRPWEDYSDDKIEGKLLRNEEYFEHLSSYENMEKYVIELCEEYNLELSEEEIEEVIQNIFDVKFADRIHNLSTQWDETDILKVSKKIYETQQYFLDSAKELNLEFYRKLQENILKLEIKLNDFSKKIKDIL